MLGEIPVHFAQRIGRLLATDKGAEPAAEKEDPPVGLDPRQRVERWPEIWQRQRRLLRRVERAEAGGSPVFVERRVAQISMEVLALGLGARERGPGDERSTF